MDLARPSKKMYGLLHEPDGTARVFEPKTVKVGIGLLRGKNIHVYIDHSKRWVVMVGKDLKRFDSKIEARRYYRAEKLNAPERKYPARLPYFIFSRISSDGTYEPDWDATESHGPIPTEIDIVFTRDEPLSASYQLWSTTEKRCDGDGINALRVNSMASTAEEKKLAEAAAKRGEKCFPIINGCWTRGCPYAKPQDDKPSPCKPHGRLLFQLLNAPRLGGTTYWDTTGTRSISQVFSCIQTFKIVTGNGDPERGFVAGIPLKMVLSPYRITFNGRSTTQYGVSLEFRAESAVALKRKLIEHGVEFRKAAEAGLLPASPPEEIPEETASAINAEFTAEDEPHPEDGQDLEPGIDDAGGEDDWHAGPSGALGDAWDPPATTVTGATISNPALPTDRIAAPLPHERWRKLYDLCRRKGMTDAIITRQLGAVGCERPEDLTDQAYAELEKWAEGYQPKQGSLV